MANISKITIPNDNTNYTIKDNSQNLSDHRHYEKDIVPIVHKIYESTSYYSSNDSYDNSTWYFMSVIPDDWYKPWRVKFKVYTYCPNYANIKSYTWSTYTGRANAVAVANWNEKYDNAHYYTTCYPLTKAGFDAGYGHAFGISIRYGTGYTNSAYYRTFEIDYYECENCSVTILDTPVKWANWTGTGSTNYSSLSANDAVNRGLQETGDNNSSAYIERPYYTNVTAGGNGIKMYSLFARLPDGTYSSFTTNSGTGSKTFDTTTVFDFSEIYYRNSGADLAVGSKCGNDQFWVSKQLVNMQYTCNGVTSTASTSSLTGQKYLYLVISHDQKLVSPYYTQDPTASTTVYYVLLGFMYDCYRLDLWDDNPIYEYDGTSFKLITIADAQTVNGHTVESDVPSNAKFTDTQANWTQTISTELDYIKNKPTLGTASAKDVPSSGNASTTQVVMGNDTRLFDARTPTSHTHGNIQNGGTITSTAVAPENTDYILISDTNNSGKIERGIVIGTNTTQYLRNNGTWGVPPDTHYMWELGYSDNEDSHTLWVAPKNAVATSSITIPDYDTKNTAGSTDTSSKIYLIGATSQAANPQTYSDNEVYTTSGTLTTNKVQVGGGSCTLEYNSTTASCDFIFA